MTYIVFFVFKPFLHLFPHDKITASANVVMHLIKFTKQASIVLVNSFIVKTLVFAYSLFKTICMFSSSCSVVQSPFLIIDVLGSQ